MEKNKHYKEIVAWAEGKTIEYYSNYSEKWKVITTPSWNENNKYRIKPEPEYIPFDFSDAEKLIGKAVKLNNHNFITSIIYVNVSHVGFGGDVNFRHKTFKELLTHYTFLDGSPCGKLKE